MQQVTTVGLDLAKNLFQVHGADAQGRPVLKRRLAREKVLEFFVNLPPCLVGLEACAAAHYWARELAKLGHTVRLMPPQYVRPYVKTNKHDAADAEAICEAVTRPGMRFVPVKTVEQQTVAQLHRIRRHRQVGAGEDKEAPSLIGATASCGSFGARDLSPDREGLRADGSVLGSKKVIAVKIQ